MRRHSVAIGALIGTLVPATVFAQALSPGSETQLQQEMRHRQVIVRPVPPSDEVQRDADRVSTEIDEQNRERRIIRALRHPVQRPPQVDDDFKGGIQTRSLNKLLPH